MRQVAYYIHARNQWRDALPIVESRPAVSAETAFTLTCFALSFICGASGTALLAGGQHGLSAIAFYIGGFNLAMGLRGK